MDVETRELCGLVCRQYDQLPEDAPPELIVILCHGFGAPGNDLVGLGPEILLRRPELADRVRFFFPEAPLSLEEFGMPGGRAWWHLDIAQLNAAIESGEFRNLKDDRPAELPAVSEKLTALVKAVRTETGLPASRVVLGGFSQGSMLATDVSLRLPEPPGLLCVLSGTLLCADDWRALAEARGPLAVLQSHGYQDPILPYAAAEWLRDMFIDAGFDVEFLPFPGMHSIPETAVKRLAARLVKLTES